MLAVAIFIFFSCQKKESAKEQSAEEAPVTTLFTLLPPAQTNVHFTNSLKEFPTANVLTYQYFYNGGGVAVGDINNDGLQDLYFSGNMVPNRLYLNKGNMQFQDITEAAGVAGKGYSWKTGTTMADVNGDGLLDIYQCYSGNMPDESLTNQLFINQGVVDGQIKFVDQAKELGLADISYSTNATFWDYDRDNDLDLFLLNHNPELFHGLDDVSFKELLKKSDPKMRLKLFQNQDGKFTDVSDKAGFNKSPLSYGLGAGVADFNQDGWPDIYISNDYSAPDFLYINNKNGTFTDQLKQSIGHIPIYSMGNDVSDINNDALPDIFTLDMLPETNKRQKLLFSPDNYEHFNLLLRVGLHNQYMRNMLQVNNGNGTFSEIGQLAGISNTDWSWAPLVADYDNDGWKDVFVSNGFLRDFTNMDFIKFKSSYLQNMNGQMTAEKVMNLVNNIPASNVNNYIFKNNGNLTFTNKGQDWGFNIPSNSNGAAYADLDNDGDLDIVTNNINEPAFIYQNKSNEQLKHHYLQVKLTGNGKNTGGVGAKVMIYANGKQQYLEQTPSRGFQSGVSPVLHFGLGQEATADSVKVIWVTGKQQVLRNVKANQILVLQEKGANTIYKPAPKTKPVYQEVTSPIKFVEQKNTINDFKRQPLMVNPMSFPGPCLVKADVNGDGLEDVYVGGDEGQPGAFFLQSKGGKFTLKANPAFAADAKCVDADAIFLDVNNDKKLDLYVASGGYHNFMPEDARLQDRLYIGDGKGNFTKSEGSLPTMLVSKSCVRASDINQDGFNDLFVGGRVVPGRYPEAPRSYVLLNDGAGHFKDMTANVAPALQRVGMVTDAAWHDLNGDAKAELILVGEWMPVTVFSNTNGKLTNNTNAYFNKTYSGWWNKIYLGDFNQDKRTDIVIGNLGLNSQCKASDKRPAELFYKDFDDNGSIDPILCFYMQGKSYPYVTRDELFDQISMMRTRFPDYASYADATLKEIFTPEELNGAVRLSANSLQTTYFEGNTTGKFREKALPLEAQVSPVYAITTLDYNHDGKQDLFLGGNMNQARLRFGKYDANYGVLLEGDGRGGFKYVPQAKSGFKLQGDVRSVLNINDQLLFGINQQGIKAYKRL